MQIPQLIRHDSDDISHRYCACARMYAYNILYIYV
jgi:hypothetical protein